MRVQFCSRSIIWALMMLFKAKAEDNSCCSSDNGHQNCPMSYRLNPNCDKTECSDKSFRYQWLSFWLQIKLPLVNNPWCLTTIFVWSCRNVVNLVKRELVLRKEWCLQSWLFLSLDKSFKVSKPRTCLLDSHQNESMERIL